MLDRIAAGELPGKHHIALKSAAGALRFEHCLTRDGFEGAYSILYHERRPHAFLFDRSEPLEARNASESFALRRRHFRSRGTAVATPLLFSPRLALSVMSRASDDARYRINADADELYFIRTGSGSIRSAFGELAFDTHDYVCVPKGVLHRFTIGAPVEALRIECRDLHIPKQFRNALGQLRMDAPYCHRDFRRPTFQGPRDENIREIAIQHRGALHVFSIDHSPLDALGWDGTVYPWAFPILAFQPRVGAVHIPPTWHGTFAADGALICSFVPRPLDFHPEAVPCPYPHSSVDVDEVIYYVSGAFGSRTGVEPGSLTLHPAGVPHGPQPGRYEASLGQTHADELAVMLDCYDTLHVSTAATALEDAAYDRSFSG